MSQPSSSHPAADLRFDAAALQAFCAAVFGHFGLPDDDARTVARNLVLADLRGIHSHGVTRMAIYTERLRRGLVNPRPSIGIDRTAAGTAVVDGDNGMGAVVGLRAMETAVALAAEAGIGMVTVRDSNHYGTAAFFLDPPLERDFIGATGTNAPPTMAPWGGREPMIGTNPLGVGVPAGRHRPIVADFATSMTARGRIILAEQRGETIPPDWALDPQGRPTTDPSAALHGAVLPFGGHKGSAIALLVEVLTGVLGGANSLRDIPDLYRDLARPANLGHFFLALDISRFMPIADFKARVDAMIDLLKSCAPAEGHAGVLIPGEIEATRASDRQQHGIPLSPDIVLVLEALAGQTGIPVPTALVRPG